MLTEFFIFLVLICVLDYLWKRDVSSKLSKLPGPTNLPIIGSMWLYFRRKPDELLDLSQEIRWRYGRTVKSWVLHIPAIFTSELPLIQEVLSHPVEIKKNRMYDLLNAWLGEGLLMSNGSKWLSRRRVITPAFHFKILEEFTKIFDQQSKILVKKLAGHAVSKDDEGGEREAKVLDVYNYIALATLDVICETAMGVHIHAQTDEESEYVRLLTEMTAIILKRFVNMAYRFDWLVELLAPKLAKQQKDVINSLHAFTERIIEERRREILLDNEKPDVAAEPNDEFGIKRRMALLDVLLSSTTDGKPLTNLDIREEVDTFMFEGHDTTKSGIGFSLYCISREAEVQEKLYAEVREVIGEDPQQELTQRQLNELKYTEKVIREALRMYPPVPFIGRQIQHDSCINGLLLPKGTSILMALISMQNDPEYFPEPERFLPEREANSNAFAFVPFSAGPRNCIGQKFAMLEMKAIIARIIQSYELLPLGAAVEPVVNIVLKSKTGWQMGFRKR